MLTTGNRLKMLQRMIDSIECHPGSDLRNIYEMLGLLIEEVVSADKRLHSLEKEFDE